MYSLATLKFRKSGIAYPETIYYIYRIGTCASALRFLEIATALARKHAKTVFQNCRNSRRHEAGWCSCCSSAHMDINCDRMCYNIPGRTLKSRSHRMNFLPRSKSCSTRVLIISLRAKTFAPSRSLPLAISRKKENHPTPRRSSETLSNGEFEPSWKLLSVNVPWRTRTRTRFPECLIHRVCRLFAQLLRPRARGRSNFTTAVTELPRTRKLALRRPDLSGEYITRTGGTTDPWG